MVATTLGSAIVAAMIVGRGRRLLAAVDRRLAIVGVAFLGWLAVCAALGEEGRYAWLGTPERHAGVLLWLLCAALFVGAPRLKALADGAVIAAVGLTFSVGQHSGDRLTGTFGSAAYLGAACVLLLPIVIGVAIDRERHHWWRAAAVAGATSLLVMLVGSGTRGAWVAACVTLAVALWRGWRPRPGWIAAAVVVVVITGIASGSAARVSETFDSGDSGSSGTAGGAGRIDEWRVGVATLSHHVITGVGPEGYRLAFHEGVDSAYERAHGRAVQPDRAHNGILDMALVAGLPGLGLYLALLVMIGRRIRSATAWRTPIGAATVLGLVAYLAQQMFLFPLAELEPIGWMLAGSLIREGLAGGDDPVVAGSLAVASRGKSARVTTALCALGTIATLGTAAGAAIAGNRDVLADRAAQRAVSAATDNDAAPVRRHLADALAHRNDEVRLHLLVVSLSPDADAVRASLDAAVALSPNDPIVLRRVADAALRAGPAATALDVIVDLVGDDPHNAYLQQRLGTAAVLAGDETLAEQAWQLAESLAPRNPSPPAFLASLYQQQGRLDDAATAATRALALQPTDPLLIRGLRAILDGTPS